ncbi:MAG: right-handed parallel beta-helix repeat-containing protein [Propionibacteriaceae bacterium]|nr:right-handed parallel beta-helix repeat-containing protein [Propionibacteriaceae bacterium]
MTRRSRKGLATGALVMALGLGGFVVIPQAQAAPITVNSCTDLVVTLSAADTGSRRDLVLDQNFADEVSAAPCTALYAGTDDVVIDGSGVVLNYPNGGYALDLASSSSGTLTLQGFTVTGKPDVVQVGMGAVNLGDGKWQVLDSTFTDIAGIALKVVGAGDITISNSIFSDNAEGGSGGVARALWIQGAMSSVIVRSTFSANTAGAVEYQHTRGTSATDKVTHLVDHSNFTGNTLTYSGPVNDGCGFDAVQRGAALHLQCASNVELKVSYSVFSGNRAVSTLSGSRANSRVDGGAIAVNSGSSANVENIEVLIQDSFFHQNFAQDDGGAILIEGALNVTRIKSQIVNSTFVENSVAGAQYGAAIFWITDGAGGAVNYYGMTESEITHSMFYGNSISGTLVGTGTSFGSVGGGGAVAVETAEWIADSSALPPVPVLSNNIFIANTVANVALQSAINSINVVTGNALGNAHERVNTGNVFVMPATDADIQGATGPAFG